MLIPDEVHGEVYLHDIKPHLSAGKTLSFSHGFSITFGFIRPPKDVDVILISPKAPGKMVRGLFLDGKGAEGVFSVWQDYSGKAGKKALAFAKAIGLTRSGISGCTFGEETHINLFAEQAVLCGGLSELVNAGFETLVDEGYPPKLAYVEVVKQIKLLADLIHEGGVEYMWSEISNTAEYGGRTRGPRVIGRASRKEMKRILAEIRNGKFAREWVAEHKSGLKRLKGLRAKGVSARGELM
ncbi:Ketol-acid reductoisomerase (NAD(+)) [uncultured archaeon]|nr:Ketol-acid reductoisomerase (NAD(+)) [uncultured archaeon]